MLSKIIHIYALCEILANGSQTPKVAFTLQANWRSGDKRGEARQSDVQRSIKAEISKHKRIRHCLWNKMAYLRSQTRRMFLVENSFLKVVNRQQRRFWIHEINLCRQEYGEYHHLMPQLRRHEVKFKEYMRMNTATLTVYWNSYGKILKNLQQIFGGQFQQKRH